MSEGRGRRGRDEAEEDGSGAPRMLVEALLLSAQAQEVGGYIAIPGTVLSGGPREGDERRRKAGTSGP